MNKLLLQTATLIAVAGGTAWAFSASHTPHTTTSTSATSGRSSAATSQHTTQQTTPSSSTTPSHAHTQTNRSSNPSSSSSGSKVANTDSQSHQTNTVSSATHPTSNGIWNVDLVGLPGNQGTDYTLSFGTGGLPGVGMILQQGIDTQHLAMVDMWSWHYRTELPIAGTGISGNQAAADLAKVGVTFHPTS